MKKKERKKPAQETVEKKSSYYNDTDFDAFDQKPTSTTISVTSPTEEVFIPEEPKKSYKEPDKQFRRNITLSEELFRRLEFIKKSKNKVRGKDDEMVTLDKLMFDMVQRCIDEQYPETKAMFEKYIKLKELEGFGDLM